MTDRLDDLLHQAGRTYAAATPVRGPRPDDVERRSRTRRRTQRAVAGGLAALALLAGAAALARPAEPASQELEQFGGHPGSVPGSIRPAGTRARRPVPPAPSPPPTRPTDPPPTVGPTTVPPTIPVPLPPGGADVRAVDWHKVGYPPGSCQQHDGQLIPVYDGEFPIPPEYPANVVRVGAVQYADLDRDRKEEAVVKVSCSGAHGPDTAWIYTGGPGGVTLVGGLDVDEASSQALKERTGGVAWALHDVLLEPGRIVTTWSGWDGDDAGCCPSVTDMTLSHHLVRGRITVTIERDGVIRQMG